MTFLELLAIWEQCHTLEHKRAFLTWITRPERETLALDAREPARATKQPVSPWLTCCRALAGEAITHSTGFAHLHARLDLLLVALARCEHPAAEQLAAIAQAHFECALLARTRQWTSDTVETTALAELRDRLFPDQPAHLPVAFLRDLTATLLGQRHEPPGLARRTILFPLVRAGPGETARGRLAQLVLEPLGGGDGAVFLDPHQAFVPLDDAFSAIFRHAPAVLRQHLAYSPRGDVRVRIEPFRGTNVWTEMLQGNSAGGALALGLWSLWTDTPLEAGVVASFALTALGATEPDRACHAVGGTVEKAGAIADVLCQAVKDKGGEGIFLVAEEVRDALTPRVEQMRPLRLEAASTLKRAVEIASGRLGELLAYLDGLVEEANRVPVYFPRGARLDRIRVRVRVSAERQTFDPNQAREREQARRYGIADEEDAQRVYRHRHGGDETEREPEQPKVEVLSWDEKVRPTIRRGVVVGDPGLGKTWLLKWEAARHAAEAAVRLRASGELAGVVLPIYRRQADVAAALHTVEERRKHIADAPPATLPDAVVESLRGRWSDRLLRLLRERMGTEQAILLLDAFDEVPPKRRAALRQALHDWVPGTPQARLLFTSRVVGYEPPWPIAGRSETEREMELLPFDDGQTGAFVDAFFAGEPAAGRELHELLRRAPQLRGLAGVPLLLGFLCALHREEWQKPQRQRRDVTRLRRTDLYRAVLERLMGGVWKDPPRSVSRDEVDAKLELLEGVAFRLFAAGKEQFTRRELRQAARAAHASLNSGQPLSDTELTRRMRQWSEEDGLLVEAGVGDDPPYLFLHLTFQEFLAARHLAQHINDHGWSRPLLLGDGGEGAPARDLVDRMAWLPAWQEVIVLLAGSLNDPLPLLEMLADEGKDDLFRHRLAVAALCLPEVEALRESP
jgi:hypothetical protein